jgi:hypothetical protein
MDSHCKTKNVKRKLFQDMVFPIQATNMRELGHGMEVGSGLEN